jgi:hypothetical protein
MVEINDNKHLVTVGAWNTAIFTPDWMKKFILSEYENFNVEFPLAINSSLRFTTPDFVFAIVNSRLEIMIRNNSDKAISCLRTILQKLIHTPILAFGINFKFNANKSELDDGLWKSFFIDNPLAKINESYPIIENSNTVLFEISKINKLRLNVTKNFDESVSFDFNYDYQVKSAQELLDVLGSNDNLVMDLRERTIVLLDTYFKLKN